MNKRWRIAVPSHRSCCVGDVWPSLGWQPHFAKRPVCGCFVLVELRKSRANGERNALTKLYPVFIRQLFSERLLGNLRHPLLPVPLLKTPSTPTQGSQILDRDLSIQVPADPSPAKLVTPCLLLHGTYIVHVYRHSHHTTRPSSINRKTHPSPRHCKNPKANKHPVRCASHCLEACFKPYKLFFSLLIFPNILPQPLRQTHVNVFLQVRLHESLLDIKMAQVKIQFARHRCQQPNTRHSNSSGRQ